MLPVLTESMVCLKAQSRVWHIQGTFHGAAHPVGADTPPMGYRGFSSLPFAYAFIIQMLSSVNISSMWLHIERWISLCSVWGRALEQCQGFASAYVTQVAHLLQWQEGTTSSHLCPFTSLPSLCHFTSHLSLCQEKLPFVPQVWQAQLGKWYRERFGSFFFFFYLLAGDTGWPTVGEGCPECPRTQWLKTRQKKPQISFSCGESFFFLSVVNLLLHQKGWRPRKRKQHARLKDFMCRKKGISFSPCDLPLISDRQKWCCLVWYNDSPVMMYYVVCMCIQALSHPSQTHISSAKNTKGKKTPFIISLLWSGSVMGLRSI